MDATHGGRFHDNQSPGHRHRQGTVPRAQRGRPANLGGQRPALPDDRRVRGRHRHPAQPGPPARRRRQLPLRPDRRDERRPRRDLGRARRARRSPSRTTPRRRSSGSGRSRRARPTQPDVVYAGTEPQGLFRSTDGGRTYEFVRGAMGPPAPARVGRRLRRAGGAHGRPARRAIRTACWSPCRPAACTAPRMAGGAGRRATRASRRTSCPTRGLSSASASTRSAASPSRPEQLLHPEPPRRLPLRRRRRHLDIHRRWAAQRLRLRHGGPSATAPA